MSDEKSTQKQIRNLKGRIEFLEGRDRVQRHSRAFAEFAEKAQEDFNKWSFRKLNERIDRLAHTTALQTYALGFLTIAVIALIAFALWG